MSLLNTRVQELRVQSPTLDKWTNRPSRYGAFDCFLSGNQEADGVISQELLDRAASAVGRDVKVPVYDTESVSIGSTRSVTIADSENTSALYTVSFTTYSFGFTIVPSLFLNNEHSMQSDFNRKMTKYINALGVAMDNAALSALDTNKSQVYADDLGYTVTGNVVTAPLAQADEIIGDMTAIANANDFYGGYDVVANTGMYAQVMKMSEHTIYNDQNKTIQWLDKDFKFTNRLANAAGNKATAYLVNKGSLGLVYRHEREALLGTSLPDGTEWSIDTLPMLGIPIDTYFYYGVGDYNAIAGSASADMTRVAKEHYGFAIEVATVVAYNDDLATNASPIMKFAIATT